MTKKLPYQRGFQFFHSSHGPCRVKDILTEVRDGKNHYYYSLESKEERFKHTKFLVDAEQVEASGFHPAISERAAGHILNSLKTKRPKTENLEKNQSAEILKLIQENNPRGFTEVVLIFSREKNGKAGKGRREMLLRAVRALVNELSFALHVSREEALQRFKKNLQSHTVNPWVFEALDQCIPN